MQLQKSFHSGSQGKQSKQGQSPRFKIDSFQGMLEQELSKDKHVQDSMSQRYNFQKEGLKRILNSSSSHDRLMLPEFRNDSSMEVQHQRNYETQNSIEQDIMRRSFIKRQESLSVLHSRRGQSSESISDCKSLVENLCKLQTQKKQHTVCHCKKSKCLKLYCQCFQNKTFCGQGCGCYDCGNRSDNRQHQQAIYQALSRNPNAFQQELQKQNSIKSEGIVQKFSLKVAPQTVKRGCKCRKTKCLKKYCECYNSGQKCGVFCKCEGCENNEFYDKMQVQSLSEIKT